MLKTVRPRRSPRPDCRFICLEIKISVSVVVGNILDHLVDEFHLALRQLAVLDVLSEEVAEDSAEVLVTRI